MQNSEVAIQKLTTQRDIVERTFSLALRVIKVVDTLPRRTSGFVVGRQLARSATSVGANVEEAQAAHSRPEFIRKMNIARGEARETHYWLRLVARSELLPTSRLAPLMQEADEIISILTTIVRRARANDECVV